MFTFEDTYTYTWPVTVYQPVDGRMEKQQFTGTFKAVPRKRIFPDTQPATVREAEEQTLGVIREAFEGFSGIYERDANGELVEMLVTDANIERLLDDFHVRQGLWAAIEESMMRGGLRVKN